MERMRDSETGMTLVEAVSAMAITSVGILALASVLISLQRHQDQSEERSAVLRRATSLLEEMKGSNRERLDRHYDGRTYEVPGVEGAASDGSVITVSVDSNDPKLVVVTLAASWETNGKSETLNLQSQLYSSKGQH